MTFAKRSLLFIALSASASVGVWSLLGSAARGDAPPANHAIPGGESVSALRAQGAAGLAKALAHYDALFAGPEREAAARRVDSVAAQRYATRSRLFWYTDLTQARQVARSTGKPILSLRLLGRLDEDYSCANSRMFRTVLYADPKVSSYLRKNFVLHWSSEREVPKITVDFGGGRVMKSTIAGNSAHYLLDSDGQPIDVIPGLYSPAAFIAALEPGRILAARLDKSGDRASLLRSYHQRLARESGKAFDKLVPAQKEALTPYRVAAAGKNLLQAEVLTMSKMVVEAPMARELDVEGAALPKPEDIYAALGEVEPLSNASRELIAAMGPTDWSATPQPLTEPALGQVLAGLSKRVAVDTLINEHGLRPKIHDIFIREPAQEFSKLNAQVYSDIFVTPQDDPWLGMAQPEGFSGLPGDGLALRD